MRLYALHNQSVCSFKPKSTLLLNFFISSEASFSLFILAPTNHGIYLSADILWIIASAVFLLGGTTRVSGDMIQAICNGVNFQLGITLTASWLQFAGGILFVVGSALVTTHPTSSVYPPVYAGEIIWVVGSGFYVAGLWLKTTSEQV